MKTTLMIVVSGVALVTVTVWYFGHDNQATAFKTPPIATAMPAVTASTSVQGKLNSNENAEETVRNSDSTQRNTSSETPAGTTRDESMDSYYKSANPKGIMDYYAKQRQARAALLQAQMERENVDAMWAQNIVDRFSQLNRILPGVTGLKLASADCRESLCAVNINFDTANDYQRLAPLLANVGNVMGTESWIHHDAKPQGAVLYLAKEGKPLPDLPVTSNN